MPHPKRSGSDADETTEPISATWVRGRIHRASREIDLLLFEDALLAADLAAHCIVRSDIDEPAGRAVLARDSGESPNHFALRAIHKIALLEVSGKSIRLASMAIMREGDKQVIAARSLITRALLSHMLQGSGGTLLLAGEGPTGSDSDHELLALVGDLISETKDSRVSIRLRFGVTDVPSAGQA